MSKGERTIVIGTVVVVLLILLLQTIAPRETNWTETFSAHKRSPWGCELVAERARDLFPQGVTLSHDPLYLTAQARPDTIISSGPVNHILIDEQASWDSLDLTQLLKMVEQGDNAFVAARQWWGTGNLLDTLNISSDYRWTPSEWSEEINTFVHADTTVIRFATEPLRRDSASRFVRGDHDYMFERFPIDSTEVLAVKEKTDSTGTHRYPVLLRMRWGKGQFYLCTTPNAFTNYALLRPEARRFMEATFALLPDRPVIWDEFYKTGRMESSTPLRFVLDRTPLKRAYWTMIVLLALTILVHARRRQRAIPVLEPVRNTSRDFAETIGRMYYFTGDHADLARKMCLYFKDELRQRLYLRRTVWDEEDIGTVAARTGIPITEWQSAFRLIAHYETAPHVSEEQLMQLNRSLSRLRERIA